MKREIGSIFEIDREQTDSAGRRPNLEDPFYAKGYLARCMVSSGRDALALAIRRIRQDCGPARFCCLLPMYTCETVIAPFVHAGAELHFYPADRYLRPDAAQFEKHLAADRPQVVLVHAHYGVDTLAAVRPQLKAYREQGGIVIEDLTQCIFMPPDGQADYYVMSLRKWLGIPDGGMVAAKRPVLEAPDGERTDFTEWKWRAMTAKQDYLKQVEAYAPSDAEKRKKAFLSAHRTAEEMLDRDLAVYGMSQRSLQRLRQTDFGLIRQRRAENAAYLSRALADAPGIISPLLYTGTAAPLYFPVYVQNQTQVQQALSAQDIYAPVLWPVPGQISGLTEQTAYLYQHMLALPCDQRYGCADMARVADALRRAAAL